MFPKFRRDLERYVLSSAADDHRDSTGAGVIDKGKGLLQSMDTGRDGKSETTGSSRKIPVSSSRETRRPEMSTDKDDEIHPSRDSISSA